LEGEEEMTSEFAIQTVGLTKMYENNLAVNGLDLEVHRGSVYGFLGLNGAGKTTTIKMLLNLAYPTSGQGKVLGYNIIDESIMIREKVGYVSEQTYIYEYMKISEVIDLCRQTYSSWDMQMVGRYLDLFELSVGKKVKELSKGMKNQLALAIALGSGPELLILDEPTGGLDPIKTKDFFGVILEQVAETGQTVFFSSHNLNEVERVADTVGIIHKGRLVFNKSLDDIKTSLKKIRVVFGDVLPETDRLQNISGVSSVINQGRGYIVECDENIDKIKKGIIEWNPIDIEVIDISLEDVFMRYTGGDRNV
jgi:ABC-2 type transport system ATP-binding protein